VPLVVLATSGTGVTYSLSRTSQMNNRSSGGRVVQYTAGQQ
jgi:hypothetical protein